MREALGGVARQIDFIVDVVMQGSVKSMNASFRSFALGLSLSVLLLYPIKDITFSVVPVSAKASRPA